MKLSQYAKQKGVTYQTAYCWFRKGLIPNAVQLKTGTIIIDDQQHVNKNPRTVIYARVSNYSRKKELEYQIERLNMYCIANGYQIDQCYKEIASGMNDDRPQFWKMLKSEPTRIVIENKDRLTRFGFNYLDRLLNKQQCTIEVMNKDHDDGTDLIKDLVSIVTSFCCRLYGVRRGQNKTRKIKDIINND